MPTTEALALRRASTANEKGFMTDSYRRAATEASLSIAAREVSVSVLPVAWMVVAVAISMSAWSVFNMVALSAAELLPLLVPSLQTNGRRANTN